MHKNGSSSANYLTRKVDERKINKRGRSNIKGYILWPFSIKFSELNKL